MFVENTTARATLALLTLLVAACRSTPTPVAADFRGIHAPPGDKAELYLLRPAFNELAHADVPMFDVDATTSVALAFGAYAELELAPGDHRLVVRPGLHGADIWNGEFGFSVAAGQTYFLAVWNGVDFAATAPQFVPIPGRLPFLFPMRPIGFTKNTALRMELVNQDDALPVLRQSRYTAPAAAATSK